ncbi:hypothetical protein Esti_000197 [Eimeria stiedai]
MESPHPSLLGLEPGMHAFSAHSAAATKRRVPPLHASEDCMHAPLCPSTQGLPAPLWRRVLPLVGGIVVNMVLGCLASVCCAMAYGDKLQRLVGVARCAALGCLLMSLSFLLAATTCHSLCLFTLTCGVGTGLALGLASACPLTAAYISWPEHRGVAAAVVLSGLSASPLLFAALEVYVVNSKRAAFSAMPYAEHPYERYMVDPQVLRRVPRLFWGLGCCCLLLSPAALLLSVHGQATAADTSSSRHRYTKSSSSSCAAATAGKWSPSARREPQAQALDAKDQQQPNGHSTTDQWSPSAVSLAASSSSGRSAEEERGEAAAAERRQHFSLLGIWMVYVLLGLSVHLISIFWESVALAFHATPYPSSSDPEATALAEAQQQQQQQVALAQLSGLPQEDTVVAVGASGSFAGLGGSAIGVASLVGRIGWGVLTDVCGAATAVRAICFSLVVLLGCCAAALHGDSHFFLAWLLLLNVCVGGISVTLPLVVAEASSPEDFSWLYTLAYTSKPASAALSSLLLTLIYPSVGLSGCSALAAGAAFVALLVCLQVPPRIFKRGESWARTFI